ncbi:MAG TPA: hypothetical protein VGO07_04725 [Candidatus Saccharimonadales bacterium]|jgi:hypothetical protein|nr:hypothetical protein [Candidatus Saccharimonadales bacterium]
MDNTPPSNITPNNPLPTLPENDELGMPAPSVFHPDHSSRNRALAIVIIIILLAAGGAVWWFMFRDKPAKPAASTNNTTHMATAAKHNIYVAFSNRPDSATDIQLLDTDTQQATTVSSVKDGYLAYVELPNGTIRTLTNTSTNDADGTNHNNIVLQDGKSAPKTIFSEVTSNKANTVSKTFWPSAMNADGSKVYFYERDNLASTQRVAVVDEKGAVTDLITYKPADGKTGLGQFKGAVTPGYVTKDEKTIYFNVHSCLNCDGPSYADVVAYDVTAKTFQQPFTDPAYETSKAEGYWTKLSDNLFVVRSNTSSANFDTQSYETTAAKSKTTLYLFDTRTNKATQVFTTDATHFAGTPLNLSADGKTFYYYTDKIVKEDTITAVDKNNPQGHTFHFATDEIRAYDIATAKASPIDLGLDPVKVQPTFMTSNGTSYLFATAGRTTVFNSTASKEPFVIYSTPVATPSQKKIVISIPVTDVFGLTYLDFSAKQ